MIAKKLQPIVYGPHSPFTPDEREIIEQIYGEVSVSAHPDAKALRRTIAQQAGCLESLGDVVARYPSPLVEQRLGGMIRGQGTLVDSLSRANPATFAFLVPTRARLGRAMDVAESNFYRLLRHVCAECLRDPRRLELIEGATRCLRVCLYTQLVEDVLSAITTDDRLSRVVRERAVLSLAQVWEHRTTYRAREFFPVLEATWEARQRIRVTGGTLAGTQEILELFAQGCDPEFVDCFARPNPDADEVEAFREFVFAASAEELDRLAREMAAEGSHSVILHDAMHAPDRDSISVFFEFFRSRYYLAMSRRITNIPGPRHTAEGYVMISYLSRGAPVA